MLPKYGTSKIHRQRSRVAAQEMSTKHPTIVSYNEGDLLPSVKIALKIVERSQNRTCWLYCLSCFTENFPLIWCIQHSDSDRNCRSWKMIVRDELSCRFCEFSICCVDTFHETSDSSNGHFTPIEEVLHASLSVISKIARGNVVTFLQSCSTND